MMRIKWSGGSSSVLSRELAAWSLARSTWSIRNTRRAPLCGRYCAASLSRRVCGIEIWRKGPSGAKVTKSGWVANCSGSSLRFSAVHFSRAAMVSKLWESARSSFSTSSACPSKRAAMRRAKVALPTPSRPENKSVWASRCPAIICSSDSVTARLPQKFSNMGAHNAPHLALDFIHPSAPVDHFHALGFGRCQGMIRLVDLEVELDRLIVHARFAVRLVLIARARPRQAGLGIHVHQDGQIGLQAAARDAFQLAHRVECPRILRADIVLQRLPGPARGGEHGAALHGRDLLPGRSEERRVGKESR